MSQNFDPSPNPGYYAARSVEERRLAMASADPKVRAIHLELAERYAVLAEVTDPTPEQAGDDRLNA